jgi:hypothetical protein
VNVRPIPRRIFASIGEEQTAQTAGRCDCFTDPKTTMPVSVYGLVGAASRRFVKRNLGPRPPWEAARRRSYGCRAVNGYPMPPQEAVCPSMHVSILVHPCSADCKEGTPDAAQQCNLQSTTPLHFTQRVFPPVWRGNYAGGFGSPSAVVVCMVEPRNARRRAATRNGAATAGPNAGMHAVLSGSA